MRLRLSTLALGFAAVTLAPQQARAQTIGAGSGCGGTTFLMCVQWDLVLLAANSYQLTVDNLSDQAPANNPDSRITQIGLGAPAGTTFGAPSSFTSSISGWSLGISSGNPFQGVGLINLVFGTSTTNGINGGLGAGESVVFTWSMTGPSGSLDRIAFKDQRWVLDPEESSKSSFGLQTNSVPEPASILLLGTGLLGLGPLARKRLTK